MMKFLGKFSNQFARERRNGSSIFRAVQYSTEIKPSHVSSLYQRFKQCNLERISLIPVLDGWAAQGGKLDREQLTHCLKTYRNNGRFRPALEIAEWMSRSMKDFAVTPGHVAIQLDLTSKVRGLEEAEKYFNSLEDGFKGPTVYSALVNCYASATSPKEAESLEKAEATMEKLRNFNYTSSLVYNTMLSLYCRMGMQEKLASLMREMESKGINYGEVTYNILLNWYADSDVERMEKLLSKMETDPMASATYLCYATAAKGYIKAGALEKASASLKKAEHLIRGRKRGFAYAGLLSLYAKMHNREDVYRLWKVMQKYGFLHYGSYSFMLPALEKLDDLDGAKKIVEEVMEKKADFDIRIPNLLIGAYCRKGDVEEAESLLKKVVEKGKEPCGLMWGHMALGYYMCGEMEKAMETTKKALTGSYPFWRPDFAIIAACLEHSKKKGDEKKIEELLALLEKRGSFSAEFGERIEKYLSNGNGEEVLE